MSALEEALTLRPSDDGNWLAFADPRYEAGNGMFGGWTAAVVVRAVIASANGPEKPSAVTVNYVGKIEPATDVEIRVRRVGGGRSLHHWHADIVTVDEARTLAQAVLVLAERRVTDGHQEPSMPEAPDPESLPERHPPGAGGEQILVRPVFGYPPFGRNNTSSLGWARDITGREVDHAQLAFLSDVIPPRPSYWSNGPRPGATMTLSVYFHATDQEIAAIGDDYVLIEAIGTRGVNSTSGQQARLWSTRRDLVATTEQLQWFR